MAKMRIALGFLLLLASVVGQAVQSSNLKAALHAAAQDKKAQSTGALMPSQDKTKCCTVSHPALSRNVKRFRGGLVFKAHRLLYHSTLGSRVIKTKKMMKRRMGNEQQRLQRWNLSRSSGCCRQGACHIGGM